MLDALYFGLGVEIEKERERGGGGGDDVGVTRCAKSCSEYERVLNSVCSLY